MKFIKTLYLVAGIYGLIVLPPMYFLEEKIGLDYPPPITHPEHFYGFIGVAIAWQIAFLIMARDPARYRSIMIPSILEKVGYGIAVVTLFSQGRVSTTLLGSGIIDLVFAGLFLLAYFKTTSGQRPNPASR
ncbi:MAG TPA: hypothetical protein VJ302_05715 [Blastocatellia bacterium]|nr:hypothetical protein [Blastocatellia bacterium]